MNESNPFEEEVRRAVFEIDHYDDRGISLAGITGRLKGTLARLEELGLSHESVEELRAYRNQLEMVNAFFIDSERPEMNEDERLDAREAMADMKTELLKRTSGLI